jgi:hypothetical protein
VDVALRFAAKRVIELLVDLLLIAHLAPHRSTDSFGIELTIVV